MSKLGVLGAGMMGAGIATVAAQAGIDVVLLDRDQEAADRGRAHAAAYFDDGVKRGRPPPRSATPPSPASPPPPTTPPSPAATSSSRRSSRTPPSRPRPPRNAEAHLGPDAIFATNTSTLPIAGLAKASRDPAGFLGIHFFSPVEKMALVEIIRGPATGDRAVAKALDFVRQIRKTPIVVNDARFFYANRCIIPYINEGVRMVAEGIEPALVENAARQLGFPLGPLQLVDETSIDLGVKIAKATKAALGDAYPESPADDVLFALADQGRLGRKAERRLLRLRRQGQAHRPLARPRATLWPPRPDQPPLTEVQQRLAMIQTLEAVRALEEGVLTDIREGDVGAILGWGFMPWSGGPFSWLDILGAAQAVAIADAPRRRPRPALRRARAAARDGGRRRELLRPLPARRRPAA